MIEQLKTENIKQAFQRFVKDFVKPLEENPRLDGRRITGITLVAAVTSVIDHKLGRQPVGWEITDITYPVPPPIPQPVYRMAWDSNSISLQSLSAPTLDIWIY